MALSSAKNGFGIGLGRIVTRYRWRVIAASLIVAAASAYGASFLVLNPDNRVFFSEGNPHLIALEHLENTYSKDDNVLFVIAPKAGGVFTRETLAAIEELTEVLWQTPFSRRVDSITNFQYSRADGDDFVVGDLIKNAHLLGGRDIAAIRHVALSRPTLVNRLVAADGSVTGVNVTVILPEAESTAVPEVVAYARRAAAQFRNKYPTIDVYLTGVTMFDAAYSEVPQEDFRILFPIMLMLILVIIAVWLRSVTGGAVTLVIIFTPVAMALGLTGWLGVVMNAGTMAAPIIILTLSVADSIHILATVRHQMQHGSSQRDATIESLRTNLSPMFITSVTTAIGFLSLNFSDAPPFRTLGNIVAAGVMIAFLLSVTLLPAALAVLPLRVRPGPGRGAVAIKGIADFVILRRNLLLWAACVALVVTAVGIVRINLDDDFIKYFDDRFAVRVHADFTEEHLTGLNFIEYSVPAGEEGGISEPDYLVKLERFSDWYREQPKVEHVLVLTDTMKRLNENMHGDDPAFYRIPESRELAAQYLLLYEMSLPYGLDLNSRINISKSASRMTVTVVDVSSKELRKIAESADAWLAEYIPEIRAPATGLPMIYAHLSARNIRAMLVGAALALVLISIVLIFALRSWSLGLLSLLPNFIPAAMAFGLWGYFVGEVGLGIAVVVPMTLGIVVDDTVHFISHYLRARREQGMDAVQACRYVFDTVGTALWTTSLTVIAGFLVLAFSGFRMNADMGLLSALTIALALLADFLFFPPLLMKLDGRRKRSQCRKPPKARSDL